MVGFGLKNYEGRIPCPYCGSTDCCGIITDKIGRVYFICITTGKRISDKKLEDPAIKNGNKKIN